MDKKLIIIAKITLNILQTKNLDKININEIFKKAKISNKYLKNQIINKKDLLKNINRYFDSELEVKSKDIEDSSKKDMIFEIMMMRFDILQQYRKSIINIFNYFKSKPQEFLFILPSYIESTMLMANLANISIKGAKGNFKIKGLLIIYLSSFIIWKNDNTTSLEKTMQSLDNYLDRADKILNTVKRKNV